MVNIVNESITSHDRIIFFLLHIKFGFVKQLVKALNTDVDDFQHLMPAFLALSYEEYQYKSA